MAQGSELNANTGKLYFRTCFGHRSRLSLLSRAGLQLYGASEREDIHGLIGLSPPAASPYLPVGCNAQKWYSAQPRHHA